MNTPTNRPTKKLLLQFMLVMWLSGLVLITWLSVWWIQRGFEMTSQQLKNVLQQQMTVISDLPSPLLATYLTCLQSPHPTFASATHELRHALDYLVTTFSLHQTSNTLLDNSWVITRQGITLLQLSLQLMGLKLAILIAALPLFGLMMLAGLVDGLNQRAIRTASLGRESSYVFHQLNQWLRRLLLLVLTWWLAIPVAFAPALVFIPSSLLLGLMVSTTACRFKKYL